MLCCFVGNNSNTEGYSTEHIPAQAYAIFPSKKFKWDEDFGEVLTTLQKYFIVNGYLLQTMKRLMVPNLKFMVVLKNMVTLNYGIL
jgi:hypothetical protein